MYEITPAEVFAFNALWASSFLIEDIIDSRSEACGLVIRSSDVAGTWLENLDYTLWIGIHYSV
jgi:hypothetical protein